MKSDNEYSTFSHPFFLKASPFVWLNLASDKFRFVFVKEISGILLPEVFFVKNICLFSLFLVEYNTLNSHYFSHYILDCVSQIYAAG